MTKALHWDVAVEVEDDCGDDSDGDNGVVACEVPPLENENNSISPIAASSLTSAASTSLKLSATRSPSPRS